MKTKLSGLLIALCACTTLNAAPLTRPEIQQFVKAQNQDIKEQQEQNAQYTQKIQEAIDQTQATQQKFKQQAAQQESNTQQSNQTTQPVSTNKQLPTCNCYDNNDPDNSNASYMIQNGIKIQRLSPNPCKCSFHKKTSAMPSASDINSPSDDNSTSPASSNWNIQY